MARVDRQVEGRLGRGRGLASTAMNDERTVLVEAEGPVTRLTINRPKALNALNRATLEALAEALGDVAEGTRVIVITGSGDKAFVAGADIAEMVDLGPAEAADFSALGHSVGNLIEAIDPIVIAEVNGYALGGGCELMMACDFSIASDNAKIGQPEVGLGVTPGFGGTTRLVRRVGLGRAKQLLSTGAPLSAADAMAWGLVNEVVPQAELRDRVAKLTKQIVKNSPVAVTFAKRAANLAAETDLATANAFEQQIFGMCFAKPDCKEGMAAFVEKRKASWPS